MLRVIVEATASSSFLALLVTIAGCGGASGVATLSSAPDKQIDTAAKNELTLTTATPVKSGNAGKDVRANTASEATKPAPPAAPVELTDGWQLAKVLDLGKLAAPPGATVGQQSATQLHVQVPLPVPQAVDFYVAKLEALGWKQAGPKTSQTITDSFAQLGLGKDGYLLTLMAMSGKPKEAGVTIEQLGNLDSRNLPRVEGAEDQYSRQSSSLYFTTATVDASAAALRKRLKADGWQEYDRAFSQSANRPETADMLFRKKAYMLGVSINKPATQPKKSAVQYFVKTLARDMPAPADASHVEIEDSQWILMCEVPRDLAGTAEFYRKAMPEIGFPSPAYEAPSGKSLSLSFESPGHDLVLVSLSATGDHATKVKLEGYTAAFREAMKKAEAEAKAKREAQEKAAALDKAARIKAFNEESKRQDDQIKSGIENALKGVGQPPKPTAP